MGASQEKKKRIEARASGDTLVSKQKLEDEKKNKRFWTTAIVVLVVVIICAALILVLRSDFFYQHATAVKVNDVSYSIADYNYFRHAKINEYKKYFGDLLSSEGMVTPESIRDATVEEIQKITMYNDLANEAGFEVPESSVEEIEKGIEALKNYAEIYGISFSQYLKQNYGKGVTEEIYRKDAMLYAVYTAYQSVMYDSFKYDEKLLESQYVPDDSDVFGFYLFTIYKNSVEGADDETALKVIREQAEEFAGKVTDPDSFIKTAQETATGYNKVLYARDTRALFIHNAGKNINETYRSWILDPARKEGDVEVFSDKVAAYVVYFVDRSDNDYHPVSVREIMFENNVSYNDFESDEEYVEAFNKKKGELRTSAEQVLAQWKEGEMTEESFGKLATAYNIGGTTDTGGYLPVVTKNAYATAINDWCFDEARKPGDVDIVDTPSGSYVIYFCGEYPLTYRHYVVDRAIRADEYKNWENDTLADYDGRTGTFIGFGDKTLEATQTAG